MTITMFDQMFFEIRCPGPECGNQIKEVLSQFRDVDHFPCPHCGFLVDLQTESVKRDLGQLFDTASEIDKQARQRGEIVERFGHFGC